MKILFLHGWQSTPGGVKPTYLKDHGHEVLNPSLPDDDFEAAVRIAQAEFDQHHPDVIVGSSRGGAVAMNIDSGSTPLVLLCPAWKRWGSAKVVIGRTVILHSKTDEVIPFADSQVLWRNSGLPLGALIEVGTEHRLADPESLEKMLWAVEKAVWSMEKVAAESPRPIVREAGVPRRFGVGTMLLITTMYAVLFAVLRSLQAPPITFLIVGLFVFAVGLGQMFLYKGQRPRRASIVVGACIGVGFWMLQCIQFFNDRNLFLGLLLLLTIYGVVCGYVVGLFIGSVFLFADKLDRLIHGRHSSDLTAPIPPGQPK
jgi:hypothetical protein